MYIEHIKRENRPKWMNNNMDWFFEYNKNPKEWRLKDYDNLILRVKPDRDIFLGLDPSNKSAKEKRISEFTKNWNKMLDGEVFTEHATRCDELRGTFARNGDPIPSPSPKKRSRSRS